MFCLGPDQDPCWFCLDPVPYQCSVWSRIRNIFSDPGSGSCWAGLKIVYNWQYCRRVGTSACASLATLVRTVISTLTSVSVLPASTTPPARTGSVPPSVSDPYSLNPDPVPARNLNPDPVPDPDPSYFLPLSEFFFNYFIIIRFSYQKKSIEWQNVVKVTKK